MRIALLVPDGVGVRNFILGKLLRTLPQGDDAFVFHGVPADILSTISVGINGQAHFQPLLPYAPSRQDDFLRGVLGYAQMYWAGTNAMRRTLSLPLRGPFRRRAAQQTKRMLGRAAAFQPVMRSLAERHYAMVGKEDVTAQYRAIFERIRPSVLFCSNQRSVEALPAVLAARQLGIPTAAFIFSWDNITSKGRVCSPYDHYFVWSDLMARELRDFYPDVSKERIRIVGTPQFEPYADESLAWSREEFFRRIGGDPARKLICFSGGDEGTCPEDPDHVRVLMGMIRDGRIGGNPQVLVRPSPADDGKRYAQVCTEFPEILFQPPLWIHAVPGDWSQVFPSAEDLQMLANLTRHADMNVNLGSTMSLDFGQCDKPVVNVAFDCADPPLFGMPVYDFYYCYEHFQPVLECGATKIARSPEQFAEYMNLYLENPAADRGGRRRLADMEIGVPIEEATPRLLEALRGVAA
jgi:hypothetical protein